MKGEASKEANESHFKLKVANYAKNGVKIKRVALVENKPYDNQIIKNQSKSRHQKSSPHQSFI